MLARSHEEQQPLHFLVHDLHFTGHAPLHFLHLTAHFLPHGLHEALHFLAQPAQETSQLEQAFSALTSVLASIIGTAKNAVSKANKILPFISSLLFKYDPN